MEWAIWNASSLKTAVAFHPRLKRPGSQARFYRESTERFARSNFEFRSHPLQLTSCTVLNKPFMNRLSGLLSQNSARYQLQLKSATILNQTKISAHSQAFKAVRLTAILRLRPSKRARLSSRRRKAPSSGENHPEQKPPECLPV